MKSLSVECPGMLCRWLPRVARLFAAAVAVTTCVGCSQDDWQVRTYAATGQITINGQPPEGAVVTLHPLAEKVDKRGSNPWGIVQEDGTFALSTYEQGDGAPSGEYAVTVKWPLDVNDMAAAMVDRLGGAYTNPERSQWKVTVEPSATELPPIEIKGAKVQSPNQAARPRRSPPMPDQPAK